MARATTLHMTLVFAAALTAACGGDKAASPASPSVSAPSAAAPAPPTAGAVSGATISGTVLGTVGVTSANHALVTGMTVSISGTAASSVVDAAGQFLLHGVPTGHVDLHFSGAGADAHLGLDDVAEHEDIHLTVHVSGSTADLDDHEREDNGQVEVEGRVTQIGAGTLRVGDVSVSVPASVPIRRDDKTVTLADIRVGDRVHVHGTGTRTAVTATKIEVQTDNRGEPAPTSPAPTPAPRPDDDDHNEVELKGAMTGRSGTCPALTFKVSSTTVVTSAATSFKDTACSSLANGDRVEVKGVKSASGTVNATRVSKDK